MCVPLRNGRDVLQIDLGSHCNRLAVVRIPFIECTKVGYDLYFARLYRLGNKALLCIRPMRSLLSPKAVPTIVINELRALSWGWKVILAIQCC